MPWQTILDDDFSVYTGAPSDTTAGLEQRARSYLHVNCSHCHRFGGGGGQVVLELDVSTPLKKTEKSDKETGIFDVRPKQGDFGLPDARIVAPGDPYRSVLFYRMAKFGRGRMPHLGSEFPHAQGLDVVGQWIASLSDPPNPWAARAAPFGSYLAKRMSDCPLLVSVLLPTAAVFWNWPVT